MRQQRPLSDAEKMAFNAYAFPELPVYLIKFKQTYTTSARQYFGIQISTDNAVFKRFLLLLHTSQRLLKLFKAKFVFTLEK